jgi:hypothetical protein
MASHGTTEARAERLQARASTAARNRERNRAVGRAQAFGITIVDKRAAGTRIDYNGRRGCKGHCHHCGAPGLVGVRQRKKRLGCSEVRRGHAQRLACNPCSTLHNRRSAASEDTWISDSDLEGSSDDEHSLAVPCPATPRPCANAAAAHASSSSESEESEESDSGSSDASVVCTAQNLARGAGLGVLPAHLANASLVGVLAPLSPEVKLVQRTHTSASPATAYRLRHPPLLPGAHGLTPPTLALDAAAATAPGAEPCADWSPAAPHCTCATCREHRKTG